MGDWYNPLSWFEGTQTQIKGGPESVYYTPGQTYYGGTPEAAGDMAKYGFNQAKNAFGQAQEYGKMGRGIEWASENQDLSNQEARSRGYDQAGAMRLAREAAAGYAPSEAAYLMQSGLNRAVANQYANTGSVRGGNAMALAQANQGANIAAMQNQTYTDSGALRAKEMAEARGLYGNMANTQRSQDQNRLDIGNRMAQFNGEMALKAGLGFGQLGLGHAQLGADMYTRSQAPYSMQAGLDEAWQDRNMNAWKYGTDTQLGIGASNRSGKDAGIDRGLAFGGTLLTAAGQQNIFKQYGGGK